jgi:hypothetical protein
LWSPSPNGNLVLTTEKPADLTGLPFNHLPDLDATESFFWFRSEAMLMWFKRAHQDVPLATSGTLGSAGVIGDPNTSVLFGGPAAVQPGGADLDRHPYYALRFSGGYWFDLASTCGIEIGTTWWIGRHDNFLVTSFSEPDVVLARPFINPLTQTNSALVVAIPNELAGGIRVFNTINLWTPEANLRYQLYRNPSLRVDGLLGFRYLNLQEDLIVTSASAVDGAFVGTADHFYTRNRFNGGQVGLQADYCHGHLFANVLGMLALGETQQLVDISGTSASTALGVSPTAAESSGLLALAATNVGRTTHSVFGVLPQLEVMAGYQFGPIARLYVGYSLLYMNSVVRAAEQIDPVVNPNLVPISGSFSIPGGPSRPQPLFRRTDFWTQGILLGLELKY